MSENLNRVKLSQWDALLVESLRSLGWSDEDILRKVAEGDLPVDESEYQFDYKQLTTLQSEQPELFGQAVKTGYQIKYNTIRGIRSWIWVALGKEAALELEEGKEAAEVALTLAEKERLASVLSFGWQIESDTKAVVGDTAVYRIAPIGR
ncbi:MULTISPECIES: hypothetical protein [Paenibacillus]|jgi:hypothetical protein|uniref:hypothetical protein n=1 Tax=Paenibacillus TaxID=44249 RepID=UPI0020BDC4C5|nr:MULTISPECIES: hypothetical protein [Paenibacillus]MDH6429486.1 hypothetical protein [Paenibacillus sp. PastH-4]MDH6445694.1 hypothetical protein [Paenibacillus sp. PastF-4]MDH6529581.1 hypothetical protein [Paenibacillus sp. PastH-3]